MSTTTSETEQNEAQANAQLEGIALLGRSEWSNIPSINYDGDNLNYDDLQERVSEQALSLEMSRTLKIVLCTGGPHCEIQWPEHGEPSIVCYGWFGAGHYERPLTSDEHTGVIAAYGEWDDLAYAISES
jgi:hypothetical protein